MAWTNQSKSSGSFDNLSKHSGTLWYVLQEIGDYILLEDGGFLIGAGDETSFDNQSKNLSSFINQPKNSASFTNQLKNPSSWTNLTKH